ncbi:hypothetical protein [Geodermatophilus nigrescens]|uniref:DUF3817 domain-containing protein n=1 Tax=Geodermatophilus nigrescens TaxID=1070870 RepID=A0A1M5PXG0_9ACTN|nr:hypothetical protein [Geodermatophilus nigrescens]SHH06342.1 hypothetical protein SAMN05444351_3897 [Geodermatophilus nigrescens]
MSDPAARRLGVATAAELVTLAVLLGNLATVHWAPLASAVGPLHGTAYLVTAVLAWQLPLPRGVRLRALVPAVGGLLVLRAAARRAPGTAAPPSP